jgi:V/A-type H+/Na+-transporting ATPase subunit C
MSGYDYGNTRLRARRAGLLRGEHYGALAGRGLPALLTALAATSYRPQAEAAGAGPGSLNPIVRDHMVSALAGVSAFYRGRAGNVVAALLGRFDLHAVLTVLRARHHGTPADAACALLVPVGAVSAETARRATLEPDLPATARFFAARRLPDADTAAALLRAQNRYEIDGDLARVEEAVTRSARARQAAVLAAGGPEAEQVTTAIRREADDLNLLLALRLREAGADGSAADGREAYLPDGSVPPPVLRAIQRAPARQDAVAAAGRPGHESWRRPLTDWSQSGDLTELHAEMEDERLRTQLRALRGGDPLGAAPVLHYVLAHQAQARNLRLLGLAAVGTVSHDHARRRLIAPV